MIGPERWARQEYEMLTADLAHEIGGEIGSDAAAARVIAWFCARVQLRDRERGKVLLELRRRWPRCTSSGGCEGKGAEQTCPACLLGRLGIPAGE